MLVSRYLGIPLVGYFEDFASIIRKRLGKEAMGASARFFSLLCFQLKGVKSQVGPAIVFRGLLGHFPRKANGWELSISLPGEKRAKWPALLAAYLRKAGFPTAVLES